MSENQEQLIAKYGGILNDKNERLSVRFRALFSLKNLGGNGAIDQIGACFDDTSELLKHELAYCLGQMKSAYALEVLMKVLNDHQQEPVVRHEAAEAVGAIGLPDYEAYMERLEQEDPHVEVRETAHLAHQRIKFVRNATGKDFNSSDFGSGEFCLGVTFEVTIKLVDPTPPSDETDIGKLTELFMNKSASLWERYRAMFALRNLSKSNEVAVTALCQGFQDQDSALFRHEVAFVLGQVGPAAAGAENALAKVVEDEDEHPMVRHEAIEALGAIDTEGAVKVLRKYLDSPFRIVRERFQHFKICGL